jgi:hypothetical protein
MFNCAVCVLLNVMRGSLQMRQEPLADRHLVSETMSIIPKKIDCTNHCGVLRTV